MVLKLALQPFYSFWKNRRFFISILFYSEKINYVYSFFLFEKMFVLCYNIFVKRQVDIMINCDDAIFNQFLENCEALRVQYTELLAPFFNAKMIKIWKKIIYSLKLPSYKKDKIWEYLNGDEELEELQKLI
jgi:hypothetical protein